MLFDMVRFSRLQTTLIKNEHILHLNTSPTIEQCSFVALSIMYFLDLILIYEQNN